MQNMVRETERINEYPIKCLTDLVLGQSPNYFFVDWFDQLTSQQKSNQKRSRLSPLRTKS